MSDEEREGGSERDSPTAGDLLRWAEKTQRTIDFMVRQQAEFQAKSEADMQRLRELFEENERRWVRTDERWVRVSEEIRALLAIAEIHDAEINELRRTQAESQARTDIKFAETGERVDALVNTVERLISERRNGGGKREESS